MPDFRHAVTLAGRHVLLEPLGPEHAEGVLAADADVVFEWLSVDRPHDLSSARALVDRYLSDPASSRVRRSTRRQADWPA